VVRTAGIHGHHRRRAQVGSPTARRFAASNAGAWYSHRRCCRRLLRIWPEQSAEMPADRVSRMRAQLSGWLSAFLRRAEALEGSQHNVLLPVVRVEHALKGLEHGSVSAKEVRPRTSPDLTCATAPVVLRKVGFSSCGAE